ncbi:hypothetical protein GGR25_004649 [Kaistia hirudinis]|uniref:Uncharacterized protein n=1 Tax=Kaistia hirudinis TaxID=1293440 RepID=A0A840AZE8_9HYPH|nr:hypothetical protein [Kaistia hirudinis]MBB3933576.1 hypothetical protein [Kaistia hirudinis]
MTDATPATTKADLAPLELKMLIRVSRPGPYVGLNGKAVQRLIELGLVKTRVAGYTLTDEGMRLLRES